MCSTASSAYEDVPVALPSRSRNSRAASLSPPLASMESPGTANTVSSWRPSVSRDVTTICSPGTRSQRLRDNMGCGLGQLFEIVQEEQYFAVSECGAKSAAIRRRSSETERSADGDQEFGLRGDVADGGSGDIFASRNEPALQPGEKPRLTYPARAVNCEKSALRVGCEPLQFAQLAFAADKHGACNPQRGCCRGRAVHRRCTRRSAA